MVVPTCRACLSTDGVLYNLREDPLKTSFEKLVGTQVTPSNNSPKGLCFICRALLVKCLLFQKKCLEIQNVLEKHTVASESCTIEIRNAIHNSHPILKLSTRETEIHSYDSNTKNLNEHSKFETDCFDDKVDHFDVNLDVNHDSDDELLSELVRIKKENNYHVNEIDNIKIEQSLLDETNEEYEIELKDEIFIKNPSGKLFKSKLKSPKALSKDRKEKSKKSIINKGKSKRIKEKVSKSNENGLKLVRRKKNSYDIARTESSLRQYNMEIKIFTEEEQLQEFLARKESSSYKNAKYKCELCFKGFAMEAAYKSHLEFHKKDEQRPYECELCHMFFTTRCRRRRHFERHDRAFTCMLCGDKVTASAIRTHAGYHSGVKYKCKICGKIFSRHTTHHNHMRRVHGDTRCQICDYRFNGGTGLQRHMELKHRQAKQCDSCDRLFNDKRAVERHLSTCSNTTQMCHCLWCGESFVSAEELVEHRKANHLDTGLQGEKEGSNKKPGQFHIVLQRGLKKPGLEDKRAPVKSIEGRLRRRTNDLQANFVCDYCGLAFTTKQSFNFHQLKHTGEKPHSCLHCGKTFRLKQTFTKHMRIHTGERPYQCAICSKQFRQHVHLSNHMLIHAEKKPHTCTVCNKSFRVLWAMKEHARTVHEGLPPTRKLRNRNQHVDH